jgi:integrase/recombinase XerD
MSVLKRYRGKRLKPKDKDWNKGTWYVWKRINGRVIHKAIPEAQTKEQAELAERKLIETAFNKKYGLVVASIPFDEFARGTYTRYVLQHNSNITAKTLYIKKLCQFFAKRTLDEITPQDCRDCQYYLRKKESSDSSVNRIMSTLSRMFTLACEEGLLERNPMQYVRTLKEPPPRSRLLTDSEKQRLWDALNADSALRNIVALATNLPIRKGQLLAITKSAIDFDRRTLVLVAAKGRDSRLVPLNETCITILRTLCDESRSDELFQIKDFRRRWKTLMVRAGINKSDGKRGENFTFHDLRKEFASELIRKNVNPNIVQKLFAHSDMSITNVYMHSEMDQLKEAVNKLDATILQPTQENGSLIH